MQSLECLIRPLRSVPFFGVALECCLLARGPPSGSCLRVSYSRPLFCIQKWGGEGQGGSEKAYLSHYLMVDYLGSVSDSADWAWVILVGSTGRGLPSCFLSSTCVLV